MTAPSAAPRGAATIDPARAAFVSSGRVFDKGMDHHHLTYLGNGSIYDVTGYDDGSEATCTCPSYEHSTRRPKWCKHCDGFLAMLEHVEFGRQAARKTWELQQDERDLLGKASYSHGERRVLNAIRAVLRGRGVRSIAAVARGKRAIEDLYGEPA